MDGRRVRNGTWDGRGDWRAGEANIIFLREWELVFLASCEMSVDLEMVQRCGSVPL
jgi:hypothetical protein